MTHVTHLPDHPAQTAPWPDRRLLDLFGIVHPILLGPMAGAGTPKLAIAVGWAGGLASLPGAMYQLDDLRAAIKEVRAGLPGRPLNVNFFCHTPPSADPVRMMRWRARLAPYYVERGLDPQATPPTGGRAPFDAAFCALVEEERPEVVSFHFGLPDPALLERVKTTGAKVISSATTVAEARWLEARGCDAIIAMGLEAGGHRATFLGDDVAGDMAGDMSRQVGTFALVPQVVDAVRVPVIAAGGIADGRGMAAALTLGASAVQVGTAFLFCPEAKIPAVHRAALEAAGDDGTALTNLFTGRPARGVMNRVMREVGPLSDDAPPFPLAGGALAPLRAAAEAEGRGDFTNLWAGQAARLAPRLPAADLTRKLAVDALSRLGPAA
ncbi:nitronate monooxygenase family protein [Xanthobacter autotrophicus]|uniref:NAD(P)H-dependent flavin oxidoreductase n=1 Tax=Xanthobacter TaxID=279 RepID=UPI0024AAD894|nr:nitronate monooxygenase family protein [Xanthobacter autotrophicus]MDI4663297.1 nitronate monooxygenase family protein [Xanthobacter autotrophicus]